MPGFFDRFDWADREMLMPTGIILMAVVALCYIHRLVLMYTFYHSKKIFRDGAKYLKREQENAIPNLMTFISDTTSTEQVRASRVVSMNRDKRTSTEFEDEIAKYYLNNYQEDCNEDFAGQSEAAEIVEARPSVYNVMHDDRETTSGPKRVAFKSADTSDVELASIPPTPSSLPPASSLPPVTEMRRGRKMTITNELQSGGIDGHAVFESDADIADLDVEKRADFPPITRNRRATKVDWAEKLRANSYAPPMLAVSSLATKSGDAGEGNTLPGCSPDDVLQSNAKTVLLNLEEGDEAEEEEEYDSSADKSRDALASGISPLKGFDSSKSLMGATHSGHLSMRATHSGHQSMRINLTESAAELNINVDIVCLNLANNLESLVDLSLRGGEIGDEGAILLGKALPVNQILRTLDLSGNNIEKAGAIALAECFGSVSPAVFDHYTRGQSKRPLTLKGKSGTTHEEMEGPFNDTLIVLDLSANCIGGEGAKAFACALTNNTSLQYLEVGFQHKGSKVGPDGATYLAYLLRSDDCALRYLGLARDSISFEGIRHISSALQVNSSLTELDVGSVNFLSIAGSMQLAQAIRGNRRTKLAYLGVGDFRLPLAALIGNRALQTAPPEHAGGLVEAVRAADPYTPHPTSVEVARIDAPFHNLYRERVQILRKATVHGMDDEMAVVVGTLIEQNRSLFYLQFEKAKLPIQTLIGNDPVSTLNFSNMELTSVDTIVIGSLIAENKNLKLINLKNNNFASSDGENFIAYALDRNLQLKLDTAKWTVEEMYTDGYKGLAARQGMSASGVAIEPQRLEGALYRGLTFGAALIFYLVLVMDGLTIYSFASHPEIYKDHWVILLSIIMCLPTMIFLGNTYRMFWIDKWNAFLEVATVITQMTMAIQSYKVIKANMETTELLDYKFVVATYKSMPQIFFQMYIQYLVAIKQGYFDIFGLCSNLGALLSITVMLIMLFDRALARRLAMAAVEAQPRCAIFVADILTFFGMGTNSADVVDFVNFDACYTAHYVMGYIHHVSALTPRIISTAWLLAVSYTGYHIIVVFFPLLIRLALMILFDTEVFNRTVFNNFVVAMSLVISDSAWKADMSNPKNARDFQVDLTYLTNAENLFSLYYPFFMRSDTAIPEINQFAIFVAMIFAMGLNWVTLHNWSLPVHFPMLYLSRMYAKKLQKRLSIGAGANVGTGETEGSASEVATEGERPSTRKSEYRKSMAAIGWNPEIKIN